MPSLFVDNLTVIDFSYACHNRGIVGASWIVDITLMGGLDEQGMIFDFGDVKKSIKQHIDAEYDHKLWLTGNLPNLQKLIAGPNVAYRWCNNNSEQYYHYSPLSAVIELDIDAVAPHFAAAVIEQSLAKLLPSNVTSVDINLREEHIDGAAYCYTHGLEKHQGNCQRIAHGHRSKIEIYRNSTRDVTLEHLWADRWRDIYIATFSHIVASDADTTHLKYEAPQGAFELKLPTRSVYVIDTESTVENIAEHLASTLKADHKGQQLMIKAYEGVGKGAIA